MKNDFFFHKLIMHVDMNFLCMKESDNINVA